MRTRTTLTAVALLAAGTLLGWLAASSRIETAAAIAQDKIREDGATEKRPAGDLGYGEVGCYGGGILRGAPTPRIDKLATEGTRLLNFNVEAQCTPSRSAIMTGRFFHSIRHSIRAHRRWA
jgi:arylsulfatase